MAQEPTVATHQFDVITSQPGVIVQSNELYRLTGAALAFRSNGMITLAAEARVRVIEVDSDSGTVEVAHESELITMFLVDLETRGQLIEE